MLKESVMWIRLNLYLLHDFPHKMSSAVFEFPAATILKSSREPIPHFVVIELFKSIIRDLQNVQ